MLKKAMIYLGLGPDEHYESYDDPIRPTQSHSAAPGRYPSGSEATAAQPGVSVMSGSAPGSPRSGPDCPAGAAHATRRRGDRGGSGLR